MATTWPCPVPARAQRLYQRRDLGLPPDKARQATRYRRLQAPTDGTGADQLEYLHWLRQSFHRDRSQGVDLYQTLDQPQGRRCLPDTARRGQLFHAGRQMRGLADSRVIHVQVVADGPHHHLPRVEAHPDAQLEAVGAAHLVGIFAHGGLHGQGGIAGPQGVIFMGNRRPEERHDAIPQHLVHRALIAVHGVHHAVQGRVQELLGGLGVEVPDQLGGVFDIGEQHRHLLALAFQVMARVKDFFGEMWWGIGQGCRRRGGR